MILPSGKFFIIKSYRDGKNLSVKFNGKVHFSSDKEGLEEWWLLEKEYTLPNTYYLFSMFT